LATTIFGFLVFIICLVGCGVQSYFLGKTAGIEDAIDYFSDDNINDIEDDV
jgi:hypothetical protein